MKKGILGKKVGMTQVFDSEGNIVPVTAIQAGPCVVVQKKTVENDGYDSLKLGFGEVKEKQVNKPDKGQFAKANVSAQKYLREFKFENSTDYSVGDEIKVDIFAVGDRVDISGITKGKGFQGVIKRHGAHRGPMGHGSMYHRRPGSMGSNTTPGRVFKGKKLPGHMGNVKVTIQNLDVVDVDTENNILLVKGAVPGPKGGLLYIAETVKK